MILSVAMLSALLYCLTSDEKWNQYHNPGRADVPPSRWPAVLGVVLAVLIGVSAALGSMTLGLQHYVQTQKLQR